MNDKDLFELLHNGFTEGNTSDSYSRLCNFVSAMRCGQYYPTRRGGCSQLRPREQPLN